MKMKQETNQEMAAGKKAYHSPILSLFGQVTTMTEARTNQGRKDGAQGMNHSS